MKKITILSLLVLLFCSCKKEETKIPVKLSSVITDVEKYGESTGSITLTVTGGKTPYEYNWSNGATTKDITGIPAGIYNVIVTDDDGDTASLKNSVNQPEKGSLVLSSVITDVAKNGESTGAIVLTVSGGIEPYAYNWSNGAKTKDLTGIHAGTYTVIVTDNEGDTASLKNTVKEGKLPIILSSVITDVENYGESTGSIILTVTGGKSPFTYSWSNGAETKDLTGIAAGDFTVVVTDNDGDTASLKNTVKQPNAFITLTSVIKDAENYGESTGSVTLTVTGGKAPYSYNWSNGASSKDITDISAGVYTVIVTDNNGDTASLKNTVKQPSELYSFANKNIIRLKQAGIRMSVEGKIIYIDPINLYKGGTGDADIILITHLHSDHYSSTIINSLLKATTKIIAPEELAGLSNFKKVGPDSVLTIEGINIEVVPAYNSNHTLPYSVGYIITIDGKRIYHSGDTKRIPEMTTFNIDIACIPMGQTYTFASINEAAEAARDIKAKVVIPIHYGLYEGTNNDPLTFKALVAGEIEVCIKTPVEN